MQNTSKILDAFNRELQWNFNTSTILYIKYRKALKDADYSILRSVHLIKSTAQKKISYLIIRRKNNQLLINQ